MQAVKVTVRMNELHTQGLVVGEWELPVLEAIHGTADVQVVADVETDQEIPDPGIEYERLLRRYGVDPEQSMPWVAQVYGQHTVGIRALGQAIKASQPTKGKGKSAKADDADQGGLADVG